jgi:hypothetical protein
MRKFLVFETKEEERIKVEVTNTFIFESESLINRFNNTGEISNSETGLALLDKFPVYIAMVKHIHIIFEQ